MNIKEFLPRESWYLTMTLANVEYPGNSLREDQRGEHCRRQPRHRGILSFPPLNTCLSVQVEYESGQEQATAVEECTCPLGYLGLSCQSCAPGYTRWSANNQTQPVTLVAELWDVTDTVLLSQECWTTSFLYTKIWTRPTFGFMGTRAAWHFHVKYLTKTF